MPPPDATALGLAGYVRVPVTSWRPTVQEQERALRAWAGSQHHHVESIARDTGRMRHATVEHRAGLRKLLAAIARGRVSGLLVHGLDVLDEQMAAQEAVLGQVWARGGEVFTSTGGWVDPRAPGDPHRAAVRSAVHALVRMRWSAGPAMPPRDVVRTVAAGGPAGRAGRVDAVSAPVGSAFRAEGGGAPALGYRADAGLRVAEPNEQATLVRILELHGLGLSLRSIAGILTSEGHLPKRAERWHPENLRRILARLKTGGA